MSGKEYKLEQWTPDSLFYSFPTGNMHNSIGSVLHRVEKDLNEQHEKITEQASQIDFLKDENTHMKSVLEENKDLRKLLKIKNTNAKDLLDVLNEQENRIWSLKQRVNNYERTLKDLGMEVI